jgi:hypothetical protein
VKLPELMIAPNKVDYNIDDDNAGFSIRIKLLFIQNMRDIKDKIDLIKTRNDRGYKYT